MKQNFPGAGSRGGDDRGLRQQQEQVEWLRRGAAVHPRSPRGGDAGGGGGHRDTGDGNRDGD